MVLCLQSGLRNLAVGPDTYGYYLSFQRIIGWSWNDIFDNFRTVYVDKDGKDAGYALLEKVFQLFTTDFRIFLIAVAVLVFSSIGRLMKRYFSTSAQVFDAVLVYLMLFYSFMSITLIRQSISISLSIQCFFLLQEKKYVKYTLLGVLAFTIHKSAIIIVLYPVLCRLSTKFLLKICWVLLGVAIAFRSYIVDMTREEAGYDPFEAATPWKLIALFTVVSLLIVYLFIYGRYKGENKPLVNIYLPVIAMIPLLGNDSLFMREILYCSIYSIVLIPKILQNLFAREGLLRNVARIIMIIIILTIVGPYKFMWQDMWLGDNYNEVLIINSQKYN